jgi:hypothetical protein
MNHRHLHQAPHRKRSRHNSSPDEAAPNRLLVVAGGLDEFLLLAVTVEGDVHQNASGLTADVMRVATSEFQPVGRTTSCRLYGHAPQAHLL